MSIRIGLVVLLMGIVHTFVIPVHAVSESAVISLLFSPGARASGMGEAFVATADDACATFWNPAGLAFTSGGEITLMKMEWLQQLSDDLYFYNLLGRISLGRYGTVGFNNIIFDGGSSLDNSAAIFYG